MCVSFGGSRNRSFVPQGTVRLTENYFIDECEVSNLSWREYEFWVSRKYGVGSPEHRAVLPDSMVWKDPKAHSALHAAYYYTRKPWFHFPVVGISHDQAITFCKWRTERVKEMYYLKYKKEINLEYRLPAESEWEFFAMPASGLLENGGVDPKHRLKVNCVVDDSLAESGKSSVDVTMEVRSLSKSRFGQYHVFGNVAEMVAEKRVSKGGSWRHNIESGRAGKSIPYEKPASWLGFRCVCIIDGTVASPQ
jgi:formylglycine-generating enzyme required for sulfatase activity